MLLFYSLDLENRCVKILQVSKGMSLINRTEMMVKQKGFPQTLRFTENPCKYCGTWDLNPHASRHKNLNLRSCIHIVFSIPCTPLIYVILSIYSIAYFYFFFSLMSKSLFQNIFPICSIIQNSDNMYHFCLFFVVIENNIIFKSRHSKTNTA